VTLRGTVYDATKFGPTCHQVSAFQAGQSEDCLHLNILQPASLRPGERLPVIVYVFGASFKGGDSSWYEKGGLLAAGDRYGKRAIWVAINYRLSAYGFLPGQGAQDLGLTNVGILDQRAALEWVHRNIAAFGGNPGRVILAGQSAGAISAAIHLLRPGGTHGLFHGVFLISGSVPT
jgi:acetylcholinesterase